MPSTRNTAPDGIVMLFVSASAASCADVTDESECPAAIAEFQTDAMFCALRWFFDVLAAPVIPAILGMAIAAMMAMTAITTSNSTKLNADLMVSCVGFFITRSIYELANNHATLWKWQFLLGESCMQRTQRCVDGWPYISAQTSVGADLCVQLNLMGPYSFGYDIEDGAYR